LPLNPRLTTARSAQVATPTRPAAASATFALFFNSAEKQLGHCTFEVERDSFRRETAACDCQDNQERADSSHGSIQLPNAARDACSSARRDNTDRQLHRAVGTLASLLHGQTPPS